MRFLTVGQYTDIIGGTFFGDDSFLTESIKGIKDRTQKLEAGMLYFPERTKIEYLLRSYRRLAEEECEHLCCVIDNELLAEIDKRGGGAPSTLYFS